MKSKESSKKNSYRFVDIETLMLVKTYDLRAKIIVESFIGGLHRNSLYGFSSRFKEYKPYVGGDDLRHLDWKLFARSDRYYIRRYEGETNMQCHILLDLSQSMEFDNVGWSKADYACTLSATLAYFIHGQRDSFGLFSFDEDLLEYLPARLKQGHLNHFLAALEHRGGAQQSQISTVLKKCVEVVNQRGFMVIVSDMMMELDELEVHLGYLRAVGHEVLLFQVLDPFELDFDKEESSLFEDVESGKTMFVTPALVRENYQKKLEVHNNKIKFICETHGIHYQLLRTDEPLASALGNFLRIRNRIKQ